MVKKIALILSGLALLASVLMTNRILKIPFYKGIETIQTQNGTQTIETTKTLVEVNGKRVVYLLYMVTFISGIPLLAAMIWPASQRGVTWTVTLLVFTFVILGGFTVGLAYLPGAVLLLLSAIFTLFIRKK